jgi:hypothetical protein
MTRREALEKRITELRAELVKGWAKAVPLKRLKALREYLASALEELVQLDRDEAKRNGAGPDEGPGKPTGGQD